VQKKIIEKNRLQTAIYYIEMMRYAYWITKATDTHSDYVIFVEFAHQKWLTESTSVIPHTTVHVFLSNMLTEQLIHNLNILQTNQQHAAVIYSSGWVRWL
jgi:hypothetical protein